MRGLLAFILLALPVATSAQSSTSTRPVVTMGADRLFSEFAELVRGRAVALVSNHSGRLADGSHLADALAAQRDVRLVALFGMEYVTKSVLNGSSPRASDRDDVRRPDRPQSPLRCRR